MGGPTRSRRDQMHITINKKGQFTFNRKTYDEMGKPRAVVFFFEKATDVIGMSSASPHLIEAFPVKEIQGGTCFAVYGIPFCRKFGIPVDRTEKFLEPEFDEKHILQLDLRRTQHVFGGRRINRKKRTDEDNSKG